MENRCITTFPLSTFPSARISIFTFLLWFRLGKQTFQLFTVSLLGIDWQHGSGGSVALSALFTHTSPAEKRDDLLTLTSFISKRSVSTAFSVNVMSADLENRACKALFTAHMFSTHQRIAILFGTKVAYISANFIFVFIRPEYSLMIAEVSFLY